jgi:hypothetical protein
MKVEIDVVQNGVDLSWRVIILASVSWDNEQIVKRITLHK